jgi:hypothetical protein
MSPALNQQLPPLEDSGQQGLLTRILKGFGSSIYEGAKKHAWMLSILAAIVTIIAGGLGI